MVLTDNAGKPPTVLLVEDNPLTRRLVRRALETQGYKLVETANGEEAISLLDRIRPDIILQDLVLPGMSGFELITHLRAHPNGSSIPILAFSGLLSKEDEARLTLAGFDGLIPKTAEASHFLSFLKGHLPAKGVAPESFGTGKLVLVVDDDPEQMKLTRFRLGRLGFEVQCAADGIQALEMARKRRPDAILTDALMPKMDGFSLCVAARRDPELASIPVVIATSSYVELADRALARDAGASAFVIRTSGLGEVISALRRALTLSPKTPRMPTPTQPGNGAEAMRAERTLRQLERHLALNAGLAQRCSALAAELSVLSTVAESLVSTGDIGNALFDVLANTLDLAGASRGAIYLRQDDNRFKVCAAHGTADRETSFAKVFEWIEDLVYVIPPGGILQLAKVPGLEVELGAGAILASLAVGGKLHGAMLLDSSVLSEDWISFATAIAAQVSLAIGLARAFTSVEQSEVRARVLMDQAADAIFVSDQGGVVMEVNRAGSTLVGASEFEIVGRRFDKFVPKEAPGEGARLARADGSMVDVEYSESMVTMGQEQMSLSIVRDISEKNRMADKLRQSQKMEAIGRLAGGVAHDFNNLLSIVLSYSDLALMSLEPGLQLTQDIQEIRKAGSRAADLTQQLLAFSRQQVLQARVLDLNDTISTVQKMLQRLCGAQITLVADLDPTVGRVLADASQLNQVIMNLVVNARDAMPNGGTIRIATRNFPTEEPELPMVELSVTDSGVGMDEATKKQIFEPFFTTKDPGRGTGLGLATVIGVVEQSGGRVQVESELGKGSVLRVLLPRTDAEIAAPVVQPPEAPDECNQETILVVEDEDQVRTVCVNILSRRGYVVLAASNPGEALLVAEQHPTKIDLLLSDIVMPRMNGRQLARRLKGARPEMKVLLMSGFVDDPEQSGERDRFPILLKPLKPSELLRRVRDAIRGRAHASTLPPPPGLPTQTSPSEQRAVSGNLLIGKRKQRE